MDPSLLECFICQLRKQLQLTVYRIPVQPYQQEMRKNNSLHCLCFCMLCIHDNQCYRDNTPECMQANQYTGLTAVDIGSLLQSPPEQTVCISSAKWQRANLTSRCWCLLVDVCHLLAGRVGGSVCSTIQIVPAQQFIFRVHNCGYCFCVRSKLWTGKIKR